MQIKLFVIMIAAFVAKPMTRHLIDDFSNLKFHFFYNHLQLEWYETLSKACYDCPSNKTDCFRPHCIFSDGFRRSVVVINRMMPGPMIDVCKGDTIIVDVENNLMGDSTTIHWHGLQQFESKLRNIFVSKKCLFPKSVETLHRSAFRL